MKAVKYENNNQIVNIVGSAMPCSTFDLPLQPHLQDAAVAADGLILCSCWNKVEWKKIRYRYTK